MTKSVLANPYVLAYLKNLDTSVSSSIGLIIGQTWQDKYYAVHVAKTPTIPPSNLKSITDMDILLLADHAKQAAKMLSGGMYVIGIFLVSETDLIPALSSQLKALIHQLNKSLSSEYLYGNDDVEEKIILNYCLGTEKIQCRIFDPNTSNIKPADVKFSDEMKLLKLECKYEIQKNYSWEEEKSEMDLKEKMNVVLRDVSNNLKSSVILFNGKYKNDNESLDVIGKKHKKSKSTGDGKQNRPITVQILETDGQDSLIDPYIKNTNNQIRVVGHISSTVWLNPSISFKKAKNAVIEDILRSLSTRLEMHCDSLIEEEHKEDANSIHEPPRRVMIAVPGSAITVSDYLFPGEGAEEAKTSVEEMLDFKIDEIEEVEGSIDLDEYGGNLSQIIEGKVSKQDKEHSHKLFVFGVVFALLVLIISVILHFMMKNS